MIGKILSSLASLATKGNATEPTGFPSDHICALEGCGKHFTKQHQRQKFCSPECARKSKMAIIKAWTKAHYKVKPLVTIKCAHCGKIVQGRPHRKFCSIRCTQAERVIRGGEALRKRLRGYNKAYRLAHKREISERQQRWYQENIESVRRYQNERYQKNKAKARAWYRKNRKHVIEYQKKRYRENKARMGQQ